jgi:hypothetical protein
MNLRPLYTLLLTVALGGCTSCVTLWKSPADLPKKIEIHVSTETGIRVFEEPVPNEVTVSLKELESDTFSDYKLDRVDLLDDNTVIASLPLKVGWVGRLTFAKVMFKGPEDRTGHLYARVSSTENPKFSLTSGSWLFLVSKATQAVYIVEDLGNNIGIKIQNPPHGAAMVSVEYCASDYGEFMIDDLIILPKPHGQTGLVLTWLNEDGKSFDFTEATLQ